jgi:hypothetical protein
LKRFGNLIDKIISAENLWKAQHKASLGKSKYKEVIKFTGSDMGLSE